MLIGRIGVVSLLLGVCAPVTAAAEPPTPGGWQAHADLGLNVTQSSYSDSWTGGEEGAISWAAVANLIAERQFTSAVNWRNTLNLTFGQLHQQKTMREDDGVVDKKWAKPKKSADRIFLESLFRFTYGWTVDPYSAVTFESQFFDASHPDVSRYLNPIQVTGSTGVGKTFVKNDATELYSRVGAAIRRNDNREVVAETKVLVTENDYRTETESTLDGGTEWVTDFRRTFGKDLNYVTRLRLFQALFFSEADELKGEPNEDYWKSPDIAWQNTLSASIQKYVQVTLFLELLYDKEIDLRGRFREVLGLGVTYKL